MQEVTGSIPVTSTTRRARTDGKKWGQVRFSRSCDRIRRQLSGKSSLTPIFHRFAGSPSSRGLGHRPFTAITGVRIPVGTPPYPEWRFFAREADFIVQGDGVVAGVEGDAGEDAVQKVFQALGLEGREIRGHVV